MFKITLLFESNEKGIYTKEEEIATNELWLKMKKERMIDRWLNILCPHLTIGSFTPINENNMMYEYKLKLIQMHLDMMNKIDN
jgi:hypothetical protein